MATRYLSRSLTKISLSSTTTAPRLHLRSISTSSAAVTGLRRLVPTIANHRCFSTRQISTSLSDPEPDWSNFPTKETIFLDGCDLEHWLVVVDEPDEHATRDEIIDLYIKTLAKVVGSEEEARMKLYSVSTRCYFAFGALVSKEVSYKLKELPNVLYVLPDSYLDVGNKDYGGEPVINGVPVQYDPKYHEEWIRNQARLSERDRLNVQDEEELIVHELNRMDWTFDNCPRILVPIANGTDVMEAVTIIDVLCRCGIYRRQSSCCRSNCNLLMKQRDSNKPYGVICASPALVLEPHGLLEGKMATTLPRLWNMLSDPREAENRVVIDGNLITSMGPGTSMEFAFAIVEKFFGPEKAVDLARIMAF